MIVSGLPLVMMVLLSAAPPVEEALSPSVHLLIESTNDALSPHEVLRLLRLEFGVSPPGERELVIQLDEREARLSLRGACPEAELHENLTMHPDLGASRARIVALAAAEFVGRELPPCPRPEPESEPDLEPEPVTHAWLPTLQPVIGARVLFARPLVMLNAGVEFAASSPSRSWWGELALLLQATRVSHALGLVEVWAPTVSLGVRREWGDRWRFGIGLRTEAAWALVNGTPGRAGVEGQKLSGLLVASSAVVGLRRYLAGVSWFTFELAAGYGWRGLDVQLAQSRVALLGGFWLDARLGVSFDLVGARP